MLRISDSHHFRKSIAGVCMVVAPLVLLAAVIVHPERKEDVGAQLAVITGNLDAWYASHLLALIAIVLAVPAVLGLMHMLREREVAYGHVGGALALIGLIATTGVVAIDGFVGWQAAQSPDAGSMVALLDRLTEETGVVVPFFGLGFGLGLGLIVLAFGLYRARVVQSWMAVFIVIAAVCMAIAPPLYSDVLSIVGAAFLLVGLGSVGRYVLEESDEDWEHTPDYEGFRPIAGMR